MDRHSSTWGAYLGRIKQDLNKDSAAMIVAKIALLSAVAACASAIQVKQEGIIHIQSRKYA